MTVKEFKELKVGDWFHSKIFNQDYQIYETTKIAHKVNVLDFEKNKQYPDFWLLESCENYDFEFGCYSESTAHTEQQSTVKEMTVADALKNGLQCGNIITVTCDFKVEKIEDDRAPVFVQGENNGISGWLTKSAMITFKPQPAPLYTPAHNELFTILTKQGLGTKAIAVHYNGKISAISIDNEGNADCHFKAEQIEKFFKLPE